MEKENRMPLLGEKFPELKVQTTQGELSIPEELKGSWTVLFSHPADFTPVCTTEFMAFQEKMTEFKDLNTKLIGLSIDQIFAHIQWLKFIDDKMNVKIEFPIIAANDYIGESLGMLHPGKGSNTVRAVFVLDENAVIRTILYYPQEIGRNMEEIVRIVKALQKSDKDKVATPANWPNNSVLGDKVIIPPAKTEKQAKENVEKFDCFDWWFCYKEDSK